MTSSFLHLNIQSPTPALTWSFKYLISDIYILTIIRVEDSHGPQVIRNFLQLVNGNDHPIDRFHRNSHYCQGAKNSRMVKFPEFQNLFLYYSGKVLVSEIATWDDLLESLVQATTSLFSSYYGPNGVVITGLLVSFGKRRTDLIFALPDLQKLINFQIFDFRSRPQFY